MNGEQRQLELGWAHALDGMHRAAAHAEDDAPGWAERALQALRCYLNEHPAQTMVAPDVRRWAEEHGLEAPPRSQAWGGVFLRASRTKLIRRVGYQMYGDERINSRPCSQWIAGDEERKQ